MTKRRRRSTRKPSLCCSHQNCNPGTVCHTRVPVGVQTWTQLPCRSYGEFNGYTTFVPRHDIRVEINERKALSTSATLGVPLFVYEVQYEPQRDRLTTMPIAGNIPHAFKRHSCMEPVLYMFPGMGCVININQAISQGATNGAPATVVQIILDSRDQHVMSPQISSTRQDIRILRHPPAYVVVQLQNDNPNLYDSKGALPPKCIVMSPKTATYSPGTKIKGWKFSQIPISPSFAITEMRSQGATMSKVLLDMNWRGPTAGSSVQAYVGMARAKRLKDIAFISLKSFEELSSGHGKPDQTIDWMDKMEKRHAQRTAAKVEHTLEIARQLLGMDD